MKHKNIFIWILIVLGLIMLYKFIKRDSLIGVINQSLPPQEAALLSGIILGNKDGFDFKFYEELKRSGILHLVVVSGSNVMLLSKLLIEGMAKFIGRKRAIIGGLLIIWYYAALTGGEIPVIRAVLLISVFYWAQILGRRYNLNRALILVVGIMLLSDYKMISEVSFWLSLVAFWAITKQPKENNGWFLNNIKSTCWVSLWITPILIFCFKEISPFSFISNVLVMGLVEAVSLIGILGVTIGLLNLFLGKIILISIYPLLKYMVIIIENMGNIIGSSIRINFNWWLLLGYYLILIWIWKRKAYEI